MVFCVNNPILNPYPERFGVFLGEMMNTYKVQFKNNLNNSVVYGIQALNESQALFEGAKSLGLDTDFETQTYTLCLEAIQTNKGE